MNSELERILKEVVFSGNGGTISAFAWSDRGEPRKRHNGRRPSRDSNREPPEYKSRALSLDNSFLWFNLCCSD
jgi:hypothetical protein